MIYFVADDHLGVRPGAMLHQVLCERYRMAFYENDLSCFASPDFARDCQLLVLNVIAGIGTTRFAGPDEERGVRAYLETGKPVLLLHGATAAFWHWDWWRPIVGYRWVRANDPDGVATSYHAVKPYCVEVAKSRHPLCRKLQRMDLPEDEVYIWLEQTCPTMTLMETTVVEGIFPQCWEAMTPWGGRLIGFPPGHRKEVVQDETFVANISALIDDLLSPGAAL